MNTDGWTEIEGTAATVTSQPTRGGEIYTVVFTYKVDDHWCGGTFHTYEQYHVGDTVYLKYNPANPDDNDLVEKEKLQHWIAFGVIAAIVLIGIFLVFLK